MLTLDYLNEAFLQRQFQLFIPELRSAEFTKEGLYIEQDWTTRPFAVEGRRAFVYKFRTAQGEFKAVRVSRIPEISRPAEEYAQVNQYLQSHFREYVVPFRFYAPGLQVPNPTGESLLLPITVMDWVDGRSLIQNVESMCSKSHRRTLKQMAKNWAALMRALYRARITHGNLSGTNVMVRQDQRLVLVDYDAVLIPGMKASDRQLAGHPDYQHPEHLPAAASGQTDYFPALVIYVALLALSHQPELWLQYTEHDAKNRLPSDNMLFTESDFRDMDRSSLCSELERLSDPALRLALEELKLACARPLCEMSVPAFVEAPNVEETKAWDMLEQAVASNDDYQIAQAWTPLLEGLDVTKVYIGRVELARRRLQALEVVQRAIRRDDDAEIVDAWRSILHGCQNASLENRRVAVARERLTTLQAFRAAVQNNCDDRIAREWENILRQAKTELEEACDVNDDERILEKYVPILQGALNPELMKRVEQAQQRAGALHRLRNAIAADDDMQIAQADGLVLPFCSLSTEEKHRLDLAERRKDALERFRSSLTNGNELKIERSYDKILDGCKNIQPHERARLIQARRCLAMPDLVRIAIKNDDDEQIVSAYDKTSLRPFHAFTDAEKKRIILAQNRMSTVKALRQALVADDDDQIARLCDDMRDCSHLLSEEERQRCNMAWRGAVPSASTNARAVGDIQNGGGLSASGGSHRYTAFSAQEIERAQLALARTKAFERFTKAIDAGLDEQIVQSYDTVLDDYPAVSSEQRARLKQARLHQEKVTQPLTPKAPHVLRVSLRSDNDERIERDAAGVDLKSAKLTADERERIEFARNRMSALRRFRKALEKDRECPDDRLVVESYDPILDGSQQVSFKEQRRLQEAKKRLDGLQSSPDRSHEEA